MTDADRDAPGNPRPRGAEPGRCALCDRRDVPAGSRATPARAARSWGSRSPHAAGSSGSSRTRRSRPCARSGSTSAASSRTRSRQPCSEAGTSRADDRSRTCRSVEADPVRLRQALDNLVANALVHSGSAERWWCAPRATGRRSDLGGRCGRRGSARRAGANLRSRGAARRRATGIGDRARARARDRRGARRNVDASSRLPGEGATFTSRSRCPLAGRTARLQPRLCEPAVRLHRARTDRTSRSSVRGRRRSSSRPEREVRLRLRRPRRSRAARPTT